MPNLVRFWFFSQFKNDAKSNSHGAKQFPHCNCAIFSQLKFQATVQGNTVVAALMMMMMMMTIEVSGDSPSQCSGGSTAGNQHGHPLDLSSAACYQNFTLLNENFQKFNINSWIGGSFTYRQPLDLQYHICSAAWPKFYITEWKLPRSLNSQIVIIPLIQSAEQHYI